MKPASRIFIFGRQHIKISMSPTFEAFSKPLMNNLLIGSCLFLKNCSPSSVTCLANEISKKFKNCSSLRWSHIWSVMAWEMLESCSYYNVLELLTSINLRPLSPIKLQSLKSTISSRFRWVTISVKARLEILSLRRLSSLRFGAMRPILSTKTSLSQ